VGLLGSVASKVAFYFYDVSYKINLSIRRKMKSFSVFSKAVDTYRSIFFYLKKPK
jgi:hypothetical protein